MSAKDRNAFFRCRNNPSSSQLTPINEPYYGFEKDEQLDEEVKSEKSGIVKDRKYYMGKPRKTSIECVM